MSSYLLALTVIILLIYIHNDKYMDYVPLTKEKRKEKTIKWRNGKKWAKKQKKK